MQLPEEFSCQMRELLSESDFQKFCEALNNESCTSVRFNPFKDPDNNASKSLDLGGNVAWSSCGKYLNSRPNFSLNPLFHSGAFYVQEASSMFLEQAISQCGSPRVVLDLCAAPGGKSTLLRSLLPDETLLVSNEPIRNRAQVLTENVIKWGHEGSFVSCNYPKEFKKLGAIFDVVVVDAPCSGEGMFRKDNPALDMWSVTNVTECALRQREIVETIWPTLKEGGYLIYSTCTYNTREDEENVEYFCQELNAEPVNIAISPALNITGNLLNGSTIPVYRFMPHKTQGEGFFLAMIRKKSPTSSVKLKGKNTFKPIPKEWAKKLKAPGFSVFEKDEIGYAVRQNDVAVVNHLLTALYPLHTGIALYEKKGAKAIPSHGLAMSRLLNAEAFDTVELTTQQAIDYLRRQAISIEAKKGYILLTFQNVPLGFVNNLGNRANNMYPRNWKIKH